MQRVSNQSLTITNKTPDHDDGSKTLEETYMSFFTLTVSGITGVINSFLYMFPWMCLTVEKVCVIYGPYLIERDGCHTRFGFIPDRKISAIYKN